MPNLDIATGHIDIGNLAIGATVSETGLGFTPQALLLGGFGSASTGSGGGAGSAGATIGAAAATGSWATGIWGSHGFAGVIRDRREARTDACINRETGVGTFNARARLSSFDADGFTLQEIDTVSPATNLFYQYLALAGQGLQVATGFFFSPAVAGNQQITGLGFKPKGIIFSNNGSGTIDVDGGHTIFSQGFAARDPSNPGAIVNAIAATQSQNSGSLVLNYNRVGDSIGALQSAAALLHELGRVISFDSDGFTIDWDFVLNNTFGHFFLAFGGNIDCEVGGFVADGLANGNQTTVSGLAGRPEVVIFSSNSSAAANAYNTVNSGGSGSTIGQYCYGWSTGNGASFSSAELNNLNAGFGVCTTQRFEGDGCLCFPQNSGFLGNAFDMASINNDGFTVQAKSVNVAVNRYTNFMTLRFAEDGYNAPHLGTD